MSVGLAYRSAKALLASVSNITNVSRNVISDVSHSYIILTVSCIYFQVFYNIIVCMSRLHFINKNTYFLVVQDNNCINEKHNKTVIIFINIPYFCIGPYFFVLGITSNFQLKQINFCPIFRCIFSFMQFSSIKTTHYLTLSYVIKNCDLQSMSFIKKT